MISFSQKKIVSFFAIALTALILCSHAQAQLVLDAVTPGPDDNVASNSITWSHTVGTLAENRALFVGLVVDASVTESAGCTYNSVSMTEHVQRTGTSVSVVIFKLVNPSTGTHDVVCTLLTVSRLMVSYSISYYGVDQTTPLGTACTAAATAATSSSIACPAANDEILMDILGLNTQENCLVGADQTQRVNYEDSSSLEGCGSTQLGSVEGDVMSWTWGGVGENYAHAVVPIRAAISKRPRQVIFLD